MIKEVKITVSDAVILRYLLSNTVLYARIMVFIILAYNTVFDNRYLKMTASDVYGSKFDSTIGVPQGDALSPVLFTVYLDSAIDKYIKLYQIIYTSPLWY